MTLRIDQWLKQIGLGQLTPTFADNDIDWVVLGELDDADLISLGLSLGHRRKLLRAIAELTAGDAVPSSGTAAWSSRTHPPRTDAERRQLSVLFCDLVGSTALAHRLDPEDLRDVIQLYQNAVAEAVARYSGHVARFLGDGVLVYFGWPWAYEDQAERAVWSGLAAVRAVGDIELDADIALAARVGIASGQVVIGDLVGKAGRDAEAVTGETPNLAARLQALAEPGRVVIDERTLRLIGTVFATQQLGQFDLKGFPDPVPAWRVDGAGSVDSRFEAARGTPRIPMIGRDIERQQLLQCWSRTKRGAGQMLVVSGEGGIGKSRLLRALSDDIAEQSHARLGFQCSPYHTGSALYPVIQRLERSAGFAPGDSNDKRLDKLEALLARSTSGFQDDSKYFAALLSLAGEARYGALEGSADQIRKFTIRALVNHVLALSRANPVLITVEDAHWIDPTTEALLDTVLMESAHAPIMLVVTHRPEYVAPWSELASTNSITLQRLSRAQCASLVTALGGGAVPSESAVEIVDRAGGIPLFVEEVTKSALERPGHELDVPASLHALLVARVDRLGAAARIAQIAAAIGRSFDHSLIAGLSLIDERELNDGLAAMTESGLLTCRGIPPHATYKFRHALIQDAAYETLLKTTRQHYHAKIADTLLGGLANESATEPEVIARHLSLAGLPERAVAFWLLAGRKAGERSSHAEAIANLELGLDELKRLPAAELRAEYEFDLRLALGASLLTVKGWSAPDVEQNYERARTLSATVGDTQEMCLALRGLANVFFLRGQVNKARELADRHLAIAGQHGDRTLLMGGHRSVGMCSFFVGDFVNAHYHLHRAISLYDSSIHRDLRFVEGTDPAVISYSVLAWAEWFLGRPGAAKSAAGEALGIAKILQHPFSLAYAHGLAASLHQGLRDPRAARRHAESAISISNDHDYPYWAGWATVAEGWATAALGAPQAGIATMKRGLEIYEGTGALQIRPYICTLLAQAYGFANEPERGLRALGGALGEGNGTDVCFYEAESRRIRGALLHQCGHADVRAEFEAASAQARSQGALILELRATVSSLAVGRASAGGAMAASTQLESLCLQFGDEDRESPDVADAWRLVESQTVTRR